MHTLKRDETLRATGLKDRELIAENSVGAIQIMNRRKYAVNFFDTALL